MRLVGEAALASVVDERRETRGGMVMRRREEEKKGSGDVVDEKKERNNLNGERNTEGVEMMCLRGGGRREEGKC